MVFGGIDREAQVHFPDIAKGSLQNAALRNRGQYFNGVDENQC